MTYEASERFRDIFAVPSERIEMMGIAEVETAADFVASYDPGTSTSVVEASVLDPAEGLLWVALTEEPGPDSAAFYVMVWAHPNGSWAFPAQTDTAEGRERLVEEFITAADGSASWLVLGLVLALVAAIGWWVARYARFVFRGDYRHP